MTDENKNLTADIPETSSAGRFLEELEKRAPFEFKHLQKNKSLLADVLILAGYSPFLATVMLQNPAYISWLEKQRKAVKIRDKEELLDSLARFSATNSGLEPHTLLSRFRRRELLRIYLPDLRNLATIAEITAELSNLADAILEYALRLARNEIQNRYGTPLEIDGKGRAKNSQICIVSLGKLGSRELNYASDIDLLFIYSGDGTTSGAGTRGAVTNREYFVKIAETVSKTVGAATGEGAAYRVDLRLRPHGRVGALAVSLPEAINYYTKTARDWERQVLLRARSSAGDAEVFKIFANAVEPSVYKKDAELHAALENVRRSKLQINLEHGTEKGFNVKLGTGGIREIEFIAQALQLAYGGRDEWLRAPHTLIGLSRLADRKLLSEQELTSLVEAYDFLRRLEHRLQMENGLQTHTVPEDTEKRRQIARKNNFETLESFDESLNFHTRNVAEVFRRVFEETSDLSENASASKPAKQIYTTFIPEKIVRDERYFASFDKSAFALDLTPEKISALNALREVSPYFAEIPAANPKLLKSLPLETDDFQPKNYARLFTEAVRNAANFHDELAVLRTCQATAFLEIGAFDAYGKIALREAGRLQTELAEASLQAALLIVRKELIRKFEIQETANFDFQTLNFGIFGLGKLGSQGMDYGSDLDLILTFDDTKTSPVSHLSNQEFYARATEILITALSSLTREGLLYRVDLRLRPDGKNGANCLSNAAFLNYLENRAVIWELLAYVKLRAVTGEKSLEETAREIIHRKAKKIPVEELRAETRRVREMLKTAKTKDLRRGMIDLKYGEGGLLDIYFAVRFLQLRDDIRDDDENRGTGSTLRRLRENNSLNEELFQNLSAGYEFLRRFDHTLRLTYGRATRLPDSESRSAEKIAHRLQIPTVTEMLHLLNLHRINIRSAYKEITES